MLDKVSESSMVEGVSMVVTVHNISFMFFAAFANHVLSLIRSNMFISPQQPRLGRLVRSPPPPSSPQCSPYEEEVGEALVTLP